MPLEGLAVPQRVPLLVQRSQTRAGFLGDQPHGRFGQAQATGLRQDLLGGLLEAVAGESQQADDALGAGGEAVGAEADLVVEGEQAMPAAAAVVVAAAVVDGAQQALGRLGPIAFEPGRLLALRASHARAVVAVFFQRVGITLN